MWSPTSSKCGYPLLVIEQMLEASTAEHKQILPSNTSDGAAAELDRATADGREDIPWTNGATLTSESDFGRAKP